MMYDFNDDEKSAYKVSDNITDFLINESNENRE